ncbi:MAG: SsrA-binding protein SmpB [Patescibacteria group bacterium]
MQIENQQARFDYEILETLTAGLVLHGPEVKSIRTGKISIKGSYVKILGGEAYLVGATIAPYQPGNMPKDYDDQRTRKLLLKKSELKYLIGKADERGLTLVPLKIFDHHGLLKLELGIARGKKKYDKRETIKKREAKRTIARELKT